MLRWEILEHNLQELTQRRYKDAARVPRVHSGPTNALTHEQATALEFAQLFLDLADRCAERRSDLASVGLIVTMQEQENTFGGQASKYSFKHRTIITYLIGYMTY